LGGEDGRMMVGFAVFIINDDRKPVNGFPAVVKNLQSKRVFLHIQARFSFPV
jgi:hypothetical protein